MGKRSDTIRRQVDQHSRIHDEANAALLDAEDALAEMENRESRRAARRRHTALPGRTGE